MSYEIGSYIDLTHINKSKQTARLKKNTLSESAEHYYQVGTQFKLFFTPEGYKAARRIAVSFA